MINIARPMIGEEEKAAVLAVLGWSSTDYYEKG